MPNEIYINIIKPI